MEKDTKKFDVKVILGKDNESVKKVDVNGKIYKRRRNETYQHFMVRIAKKKGNGRPFLKYMQTGHYYGYTKEQYKEYVLGVNPANKKLRNKIAAAGTAAVFGVGLLASQFAPSLVKAIKDDKNSYAKTTTSQSIDDYKSDNQKFNKICKKLLKYENGEEIVETLKLIDKHHKKINEIAIQNPDANGKVSYIKAEELAAISDVYNAQNDTKTLTETEDRIRCLSSIGQSVLINLSQGSKKVGRTDELFKTKKLSSEQKKLQDETQATLDNNNIATPGLINMMDDIYKTRNSNPELQVEVAFGQSGLAGALTDQLSGDTLENYQSVAKEEVGQYSYLIETASVPTKKASIEDNEENLEKQKLINSGLKAIDDKRLKGLDRTDYNPSTTEKGKDMVKQMFGDLGITASGSYVIKPSTSSKHTTKVISREEAIERFGKSKIEQIERTIKVDTDGDGKNDTPLDKANIDSKKQGEKDAKDKKAGFEAGQRAFSNGDPSTTSKGSAAYREEYAKGYQRAKDLYEKQQKQDSKKEENNFVKDNTTTKPSEPTPEPEKPPVIDEWHPETTQTTQPTRQKVEKVETYESQPENEVSVSKVRTRA